MFPKYVRDFAKSGHTASFDESDMSRGLANAVDKDQCDRNHGVSVQKPQQRVQDDRLQGVHWIASQLKRWILGTHASAVRPHHLQAYLDEFTFRYNRRTTNGVGRVAARTIEGLVANSARTMRKIIENATPYPAFQS